MKRTNVVLVLASALGISAFAGVTAAADSNLDGDIEVVARPLNATAALRHLENVSATLIRSDARLVRLIDVGPPSLPPDPCANPLATSCQEVHAIETIDREAETFLASVAALDNGADRAALHRRLSYSTATFAWASTRIAGLTSDWIDRSPSESPPDPCGPHVVANVDLLTSAAEFADRRIGAIDSCSDPASIDRRLGHVVVGLDGAAARLDKLAEVGFNPQPDPPGSPVLQSPPEPDKIDRELDAIIARAEYVASTARALKSSGEHLLISGPQGQDVFH